MFVLGIDTSGRAGSVALAEANGSAFELLEFTPLSGGSYSAELVPRIADLLSKRAIAKSDIGLIGVASGPGSFTGLRVAIATVKGLAEAFGTPVVAVSVLEAVAFRASGHGSVLAALDAQRGEVFLGEYRIVGHEAVPQEADQETIAKLADFATWVSARNPVPVTYTPDATVERAVREAGSPVELIARPSADLFARIAYEKFSAGVTADAATLDANYVRRSDAELFSAPKLGIVPR